MVYPHPIVFIPALWFIPTLSCLSPPYRVYHRPIVFITAGGSVVAGLVPATNLLVRHFPLLLLTPNYLGVNLFLRVL
jgi:hypothetical protein